nr:nuclear transport factor 2 family protein [uncultured Undibacterium sp.]
MTTPQLQNIMGWYANLSPTSLKNIAMFYSEDARFKDPFNEVQGIPAIQAIFEHMFTTTQYPKFMFDEVIEQGSKAFLTWKFHFGLSGKSYIVKGGSMLTFDENGLITDHRDYWDAAEELWEKLPIVGGLVGWLRRRFRVQT